MFSIDEISNGAVNLDNKVIYSLQLEIIELNDEINITAGATFAGCCSTSTSCGSTSTSTTC